MGAQPGHGKMVITAEERVHRLMIMPRENYLTPTGPIVDYTNLCEQIANDLAKCVLIRGSITMKILKKYNYMYCTGDKYPDNPFAGGTINGYVVFCDNAPNLIDRELVARVHRIAIFVNESDAYNYCGDKNALLQTCETDCTTKTKEESEQTVINAINNVASKQQKNAERYEFLRNMADWSDTEEAYDYSFAALAESTPDAFDAIVDARMAQQKAITQIESNMQTPQTVTEPDEPEITIEQRIQEFLDASIDDSERIGKIEDLIHLLNFEKRLTSLTDVERGAMLRAGDTRITKELRARI